MKNSWLGAHTPTPDVHRTIRRLPYSFFRIKKITKVGGWVPPIRHFYCLQLLLQIIQVDRGKRPITFIISGIVSFTDVPILFNVCALNFRYYKYRQALPLKKKEVRIEQIIESKIGGGTG